MKSKLFSNLLAVLMLATATLAMPPMQGTFEPNYPAGVNAPPIERLNRDNPDLEGEWNCLVILIDFPDYTWDNQNDSNFANEDRNFTTEHFGNMLFSEGEFAHPGATSDYTGSMRDYYSEISMGNFTTTGVATRWYRAPENYSYYCNQDGETGTEDDFGFGQAPNNAQGLVAAAVQLADDDVDFSMYDNDQDGMVDAIFIIHAGPGAEEFGDAGASYIWSHKWQMEPINTDGVSISTYTMEPENGTVGVFCHEFGHALGLPDLYDTDDTSEGVGEWCLMGGGGWCFKPGDPFGTSPAHMSGWAKMKLDWTNVHDIDENSQWTIQPIEGQFGGTIFRTWRNGQIGDEYYIIENRQPIGFDAGLTRRQIDYNLPAPFGLLITHIDETVERNQDDARRLVDVVEASPVRLGDGSWFENLSVRRRRPDDRSLFNPNRGDNGDLWPGFTDISDDSSDWVGERSRERFGINTIPATNDNDGNPTFVEITVQNLQEDGAIDFQVMLSPPEEPLIIIGDVAIDDGDEGNGIFEPGDVLNIVPNLRNVGQQVAVNVSMSLTFSGDLDIGIEPQGAIGYPNIESGEEVTPAVAFTVTIPEDAPDNATITLDGNVVYNNGQQALVQVIVGLTPPGEWIKFPDNPVLAGTPGEWDSRGIAGVDILEYGDSLVAYYLGGSDDGELAIGRATSFDFGETWVKYPEPVIAGFNQDWAAGDVNGLAVIQMGNRYTMVISAGNGDDENEIISIGKATSENGIDWDVSADPIIGAGGWCIQIFPLGQIDLFAFGNAFICSYGGTSQQGFVALGAARSLNLNNWAIDQQPSVLPTFSEETFDGFACFAPDMYFGADAVSLTYSGFGGDFAARIGMMNVIDEQNFERHEGTETGGSILEAKADGWEGGGFMLGSRLFTTPNGMRMLYAVAGEGSAAVGLAVAGEGRSVPNVPEADEPLLPQQVELGEAFPNPFNGQTEIPFRLGRQGEVTVSIIDVLGRTVTRTQLGSLEAGQHTYSWQAPDGVGSGIYFVKLATPFGVDRSRIVLLK